MTFIKINDKNFTRYVMCNSIVFLQRNTQTHSAACKSSVVSSQSSIVTQTEATVSRKVSGIVVFCYFSNVSACKNALYICSLFAGYLLVFGRICSSWQRYVQNASATISARTVSGFSIRCGKFSLIHASVCRLSRNRMTQVTVSVHVSVILQLAQHVIGRRIVKNKSSLKYSREFRIHL